MNDLDKARQRLDEGYITITDYVRNTPGTGPTAAASVQLAQAHAAVAMVDQLTDLVTAVRELRDEVATLTAQVRESGRGSRFGWGRRRRESTGSTPGAQTGSGHTGTAAVAGSTPGQPAPASAVPVGSLPAGTGTPSGVAGGRR